MKNVITAPIATQTIAVISAILKKSQFVTSNERVRIHRNQTEKAVNNAVAAAMTQAPRRILVVQIMRNRPVDWYLAAPPDASGGSILRKMKDKMSIV